MAFNTFFVAFLLVCGVALFCETKCKDKSHPFWLAVFAGSTGLIPITLAMAVLAAVLEK